jgi:Pentapeptide repeats (8 copies)
MPLLLKTQKLPNKHLTEGNTMQIRFNTQIMLTIPVLVALVISLLPVPSSAFVPEDLQSFKESKKCPGCDLRGADLRGLNLTGSNLEGANLMGANLEGVTLEEATLDDASCEKTNFRKAKLHGTSMDHATIDEADFNGADLQDVTWIDGRVCKKGSIGVCK